MKEQFSDLDLKQFGKKRITQEQVLNQLNQFKNGFKPAKLAESATLGNGILDIKSELNFYIDEYDKADVSALKFVPASGAATRMFKSLFEFRSDWGVDGNELKEGSETHQFFSQLGSFAFYDDLKSAFEKTNEYSIDEALQKNEFDKILDALLGETGLNYGKLPKGLLKFHRYNEEVKTPTEEHLTEGEKYANKSNQVKIHFTVSPEHQDSFEDHVKSAVQNKSLEFDINFSTQKPSTDTIAVDPDNVPFRTDDGNILFRPAGHGALLENLNELSADIIFIKNIDNVVPDHLKPETITYKKAIAGLLLTYQKKAFDLLNRNETGEDITGQGQVLLETMGINDVDPKEVVKSLNRPIRVCGMVKNEGEPGGGPFWIKDKNGTTSLQIVESAQLDKSDKSQVNIFNDSTHFNPVDLVCGVKNYKGEKFDLLEYRDLEAGFISEKSSGGKKLRAMELPGLWNGSMANWNTVFVEVPLITFNPVKTVNDLLKENHR